VAVGERGGGGTGAVAVEGGMQLGGWAIGGGVVNTNGQKQTPHLMGERRQSVNERHADSLRTLGGREL